MNYYVHLTMVIVLLTGGNAWANVEFWAAPACLKITENARPLKYTSPLKLNAARGEYTALQICLRSKNDISGVSVHSSRLNGPSPVGISNIRIWQEHYVKTNQGYLPDPLTPWRLVDLRANTNQTAYVEIYVPVFATAGDYEGSIQCTAGGKSIANVAIRLHVYDFALPVTPILRTAFGLHDNHMAIQEQLSTTSNAYQTYRKAYYEILLEHGLSPYHIPVDIMSTEAIRYLNDPRMTSYVIPYSENDETMKATIKYLRNGGWLRKGFFYVVDEPKSKEQYAKLIAVCERLHKMDPTLKIVSPYYTGPDWDKSKTPFEFLTNHISIWCYNTPYHHPDKLTERQKKGDEVWDYVCCGPGKPFANFFITNDAIDHRVLFWQNYKYTTTGLLYWSANYWNNKDSGTTDPWVDMATIKFINKDIYGDGSLLYPGRKVGYYGPLPSLRLKLIRLGVQDYTYMKMAEAKIGKARVKKIVNSQVQHWKNYQKDPIKLDAARDHLAQLIEGRTTR